MKKNQEKQPYDTLVRERTYDFGNSNVTMRRDYNPLAEADNKTSKVRSLYNFKLFLSTAPTVQATEPIYKYDLNEYKTQNKERIDFQEITAKQSCFSNKTTEKTFYLPDRDDHVVSREKVEKETDCLCVHKKTSKFIEKKVENKAKPNTRNQNVL